MSKFTNFIGSDLFSLTAGSLRTAFGNPSSYEGDQGNLQQGLDSAYDTVSDVVGQFGPWGKVMQGFMKANAALNGLASKVGMGTDGMTTTDAVLGSNFLAPIGWINGAFGKKTNTIHKDEQAFSTVGASYGGSSKDVDWALSHSGKKYGLFSRGQMNEANEQIANADIQQDIIQDISRNTREITQLQSNMADMYGNATALSRAGGFSLKYARAGKHGYKMLPEHIVTPDVEYNMFLNSLPPNLKYSDDYNMYRYWELNGKPANFGQGLAKGMFKYNKNDRSFHAGSIVYNPELDEYDFVKAPNHPTLWMEIASYNGYYPVLKKGRNQESNSSDDYDLVPFEGDAKALSDLFRNDYILDTSGPYYKYKRRVPAKKEGGIIIKAVYPDTLEKFLDGGKVNIIPEGALHARLHHMDNEDITSKGIPVVDTNNKQLAEIERSEIIFRLSVTKNLEELAKQGDDEAAIEAGKLLAHEILNNTIDYTKELL